MCAFISNNKYMSKDWNRNRATMLTLLNTSKDCEGEGRFRPFLSVPAPLPRLQPSLGMQTTLTGLRSTVRKSSPPLMILSSSLEPPGYSL